MEAAMDASFVLEHILPTSPQFLHQSGNINVLLPKE
jgi:hypothetical protein